MAPALLRLKSVKIIGGRLASFSRPSARAGVPPLYSTSIQDKDRSSRVPRDKGCVHHLHRLDAVEWYCQQSQIEGLGLRTVPGKSGLSPWSRSR